MERVYEVLSENSYEYNYKEKESDGHFLLKFGKRTPCGEDWQECIRFDGTYQGFLSALSKRVNSFDIDTEIEPLLACRGKFGCPSSVLDLVDDAKWKHFELLNLVQAFPAPIKIDSNNFPLPETSELPDVEKIKDKILAEELWNYVLKELPGYAHYNSDEFVEQIITELEVGGDGIVLIKDILKNICQMQYSQNSKKKELKPLLVGDYVISPIQNAYNDKISCWLSKKDFTLALYMFTVYGKHDLEQLLSMENLSSYFAMYEELTQRKCDHTILEKELKKQREKTSLADF